MKRTIGTLLVAASAALMLTPASAGVLHPATSTNKQATFHPAMQQGPVSSVRAGQGKEQSLPPAMLEKRRALELRRQAFFEQMKKRVPGASGLLSGAINTPPGFSSPGFFQGEVFTPGVPTTDPGYVTVALSADINKDGLPDIINIQDDAEVSVLLNPGKGKLSTMVVSSTNTSAKDSYKYVEYATTVDLAGDGFPELVVMDGRNSSLMIFPNNKDGTFGKAFTQPIKFNSGSSYGSGGGLAFGDFNGDGHIDMAAFLTLYGYDDANHPETAFELQVFPGKGDGTFGAPVPEQYTLISGFLTTQPGQVAVSDVNNDGKLDIAYIIGGFDDKAHNSGELYVDVLLGHGDGTFTGPQLSIPDTGAIAPVDGNGGLVGGLSLADIDGDGNPDILFTNCTDQTLYYSVGRGDGTFNSPTTPITRLGYPQFIGFTDVTGDGLLDVVSYGIGYTSVYPALGKGNFGSPLGYVSGMATPIEPAPADFDGDGRLDIARTDPVTNLTTVQLQRVDGTIAASPVLQPANESASLLQAITTADFNGDGFPDVLVLDYATFWKNEQNDFPYPEVKIGINDGKGNFTYKLAVSSDTLRTILANGVEEGLIEPMVADFNGDGLPDLILRDTSAHLWLVASTGPAAFAAPVELAFSLNFACAFSRIDIGDVNGDGKKDIVFAYAGDSICSAGSIPSGVAALLSNGDGTFKTAFTAVGKNAFLPKLIDFNGDGKLDLALSEIEENQTNIGDFEVLPGNGDGTFDVAAMTKPLASGMTVTAIIAGDYDGDKKQDLTVGVYGHANADGGFDPGTTGIQTFHGNGDFTFGPPQIYTLAAYPYDGQYADFNGDGQPDLALNVGFLTIPPIAFIGNFGYMMNVGGSLSAFKALPSVVFDYGSYFYPGDANTYGNLMVADFNGDGAPDVLTVVDYDAEEHYASSIFLNAGAIKLSLTSSANAVIEGTPVSLSATLAPTVSAKTPSGTVTFYDNGTLLNTVQVSASTVSFLPSSLNAGNHSFTAAYSGDENFNAALAVAAVTVAVAPVPPLAPSFTLASSASTVSVAAGGSGTATLTLNSNATFNGAVTLSCSGAPNLSTCIISPSTVTMTGSQTTSATVVLTTQASQVVKASLEVLGNQLRSAGVISMAGLILLMLPGGARRLRQASLLALLVFGGSLTMLTVAGCAGASNPPKILPGTAAGNSTLTITATSGAITQTQAVILTVQ